ncbi:2-thiouracil desulfurase family protein [Clostridium senegalense]
MILVSGCLCGVNCKYNGGNNLDERVLKLLQEGQAMPICPEQLGGQATPRVAHEIIDGDGAMVLDGKARVLSPDKNDDATEEFLKGANEALNIAKSIGAEYAILKARSPSCGFGKIYDGTFSGNKKDGNGVAAELLYRNGIKIFTEETLEEFLFQENNK